MNNPYTELRDFCLSVAKELGYEAYEYIPSKATYPFIFVGEQFNQDRQTKLRTLGQSNIILHVYHHHDERKEAEEILAQLNKALHELDQTEHFSWGVFSSQSQTFFDGEVKGTALVHCVLDITLNFR